MKHATCRRISDLTFSVCQNTIFSTPSCTQPAADRRGMLPAPRKHVPIVTAVLVLPFHDMRRLAGEICQADCLTGGRLQLGVGRGAFRYEFDRMGIPFEEAKPRFAESLQVLIKLLSEEEVSWQGTYYNFDTLTITPRPVQRPHPPIWIAALNSESIADATRRGFSVMTTPLRDAFGVARDQALAFRQAMSEMGSAGKSALLDAAELLC